MSTIKSDRKDFEMLLNGIAPLVDASGNALPAGTTVKPPCVDSSANADDFTVQKQFDFDYEGTKKTLRKRARKTLTNIVEHILPEDMMDEEYVKDKMEQDINTLADLYFQVELNSVMQRSLVENVSRGNTMPRMYEVFSGFTDRMQALNKQIVSTEQQIRRTYLDIKMEIREKTTEAAAALNGPQQNALENGAVPQGQGIIVSSSKQLIEMAKKKHLEKMRAAQMSAQEAEYTEE